MTQTLAVESNAAESSNGTTRKRAARTSLAGDAIAIVGTVPLSAVPDSPRGKIGKRRWEELAMQIIGASQKTDRDPKGETLQVTLAAGARAEIVRAGISEELKRHGYSAQTRSFVNDDGSTTLFLFAVVSPKSEQ